MNSNLSKRHNRHDLYLIYKIHIFAGEHVLLKRGWGFGLGKYLLKVDSLAHVECSSVYSRPSKSYLITKYILKKPRTTLPEINVRSDLYTHAQ